MEILRFFLTFLLEEYDKKDFIPLIDNLIDANFDLKKFLSSLDIKQATPIIKYFINKNPAPNKNGVGLDPIKNIADKKVKEFLSSLLTA